MLEITTTIVRGLILVALLLLTGTAAADRLVARASAQTDATSHAIIDGWLSRLPGLLAWFLLTLSLLRGALQVLSFTDPGAPIDPDLARALLTGGSWGIGWMVQTIGAFVLLAMSWVWHAAPVRRRVLLSGCIAIVLLAQAGMGHGVDPFWQPLALGRLVHAGHLLGAGIWIGTLTILTLAVFPTLLTHHEHHALRQLLGDFSVMARAGAALLVGSGVIATFVYLTAVSDLWQTDWGNLLLLKLLLVAAVVGAGFRNWRVLTPRLNARAPGATAAFRRAVVIEVLLAAAVLAVTALLVGSATPRS